MASVFPEMFASLLEKPNFFQSTKANFSPTFKRRCFPRSSSLFFQILLGCALHYQPIPCFSLSHWNFNVVICFLTKLSFLTVGPSFIYLGLSCVKKWSVAYSRLSLKGLIENIQVLIFWRDSTLWHLTLHVSFLFDTIGPTAGPSGPAARPGDACSPRDGFWSAHSWSREAQTHPAAACSPSACSQVPAPGAGQRGGEAVQPPPLSDNEECPKPHDTLPVRQVLPRWVNSKGSCALHLIFTSERRKKMWSTLFWGSFTKNVLLYVRTWWNPVSF